MMDMLSETQWVALIGLGGGILLGLAARLGRFCTLGAIEDMLYGGSADRMRMWGLAIGVAGLSAFAAVALGGFDIAIKILIGVIGQILRHSIQ